MGAVTRRRKPRWTITTHANVLTITHPNHNGIIINTNDDDKIIVTGATIGPASNNALRLIPKPK